MPTMCAYDIMCRCTYTPSPSACIYYTCTHNYSAIAINQHRNNKRHTQTTRSQSQKYNDLKRTPGLAPFVCRTDHHGRRTAARIFNHCSGAGPYHAHTADVVRWARPLQRRVVGRWMAVISHSRLHAYLIRTCKW